ncbi:MAG: hypothetical protein AB7P02_23175, partial [Alphaproteobacteria bacterium]
MAVDGEGSAFIAGYIGFNGTVDFDPAGTAEFPATQSSQAFLAKYDASGAYQWAWVGGGAAQNADRAYDVAVAPDGDAVVVGMFNGTADFDPTGGVTNLEATGAVGANFNHFVARYDSDGNLIWARTSGGSTNTEVAHGVDVGPDGHAYVVGTFLGTVDFDHTAATTELVSSGSPSNENDNYFVARYDADGTLVWAHTTGPSEAKENAYAVALDGKGNLFVAGDFGGTVDFDDDPAGTVELVAEPANYTTNMFVAKYSTAGDLLWARTAAGPDDGIETAAAVTVDNDGNVIVVGSFDGTMQFGDTTLTATGAQYSFNYFVAKYDTNGNLLWATTTGPTDNDNGESAFAVSTDDKDNVYVSGTFSGTVDFDPGAGELVASTESYLNRYFIARYSAAGVIQSVTTTGSPGDSEAINATAIEDDRFYATGLFVGTVDFDPGPDPVIRDSDVSQQKHFLVEFDLPVSAGSGNDGGGSTPPDRVPPPAPRIAAFDTDTGNPNDHF